MRAIWIVLLCIAGLSALLFLALLFLIKPNRRRPVPWVKGHVFAHRGLHGGPVPENSLAAFRAARERGLGVELDIQLTRDGEIVVFHDDSLLRVCGVDKKVEEVTFAQLEEYRLCGTGERVPRFSEALETLSGAPVICEIKPCGDLPSLCSRAAGLFDAYGGEICMESFTPFAVRWFKKHRPDVVRGQLSARFAHGEGDLRPPAAFAMRNLLVNVLGRPDFIAYDHTADSFGFRLCRGVFRPLCVGWTARGEEETQAAKRRFDAVIFEEGARGPAKGV